MKIPLTKAIANSIFEGVLSGEGDIFAKMASSSVNANDPYLVYPAEIAGMVDLLKKTVDPSSRLYGKGKEYANAFLEDEENEFLSEDES
jgi:hypothetical protein